MSKVSAKTRYETFMEWHKWASTRYQSMRKKKKVQPDYLSKEEY